MFCGCEPDKLPKDVAEELPKELQTVLTLMLQEKAKEVEAPACGRAAARACGVMYEQSKRRF